MNPNRRPVDPNDPAPEPEMLDRLIDARIDFITEGAPLILEYCQSRTPWSVSTWYAEVLLDGHRWTHAGGPPSDEEALGALYRVVKSLRPGRAAAWKHAKRERRAAEAAARRP